MDDLFYLIAQDAVQNSFGDFRPNEKPVPIWGSLRSISRTEWSEAGKNGLNPQFVVVTAIVNYHSEKVIEVQGKRFGIYRAYIVPNSDQIELYCEGKSGI